MSGIHALYDLGYLHRDINPNNILIKKDEFGHEVPVLTGFSFAIKRELVSESAMCGTPGYIAPEVINKRKCSERMDLFSLGITLIQMISGIASSADTPETEVLNFVTLPSRMRCQVTDKCWSFIQHLTMKDPVKRMTHEDLWKDPWICATEKDLADSFMKDLVDNWSFASKDLEGRCVNEISRIIQTIGRVEWPISLSPAERKALRIGLIHSTKHIYCLSGGKGILWKQRMELIRNLLKKAEVLESEVASATSPEGTVNKIRMALWVFWIIDVCQDEIDVKDKIEKLSLRLSSLENE